MRGGVHVYVVLLGILDDVLKEALIDLLAARRRSGHRRVQWDHGRCSHACGGVVYVSGYHGLAGGEVDHVAELALAQVDGDGGRPL